MDEYLDLNYEPDAKKPRRNSNRMQQLALIQNQLADALKGVEELPEIDKKQARRISSGKGRRRSTGSNGSTNKQQRITSSSPSPKKSAKSPSRASSSPSPKKDAKSLSRASSSPSPRKNMKSPSPKSNKDCNNLVQEEKSDEMVKDVVNVKMGQKMFYGFSLISFMIVCSLAILYTYIVSIGPCKQVKAWPQFNMEMFDKNSPRHNDALKSTVRLAEGNIYGPETVLFNKRDEIFGLTKDGLVAKIHPNGQTETYVDLNLYSINVGIGKGGTRPLGGAFSSSRREKGDAASSSVVLSADDFDDVDDNERDNEEHEHRAVRVEHPEEEVLYVADAAQGLVRIGEDKTVRVVSQEANGKPILYCNDVDVGRKSGYVYFSDSSDIAPLPMSDRPELLDTLSASITDCIRAKPSGRLLRYDPATQSTIELVGQIWFANGVAVEPVNESYVLVYVMMIVD